MYLCPRNLAETMSSKLILALLFLQASLILSAQISFIKNHEKNKFADAIESPSDKEISLPNVPNKKIFISYLTSDAGKLAGLLAQKLRILGRDVFYAQESLLSGCVYPDVLNRELLARDIFVPLITTNYANHDSNRSRWCLSEVTVAFNEKKKMKPINFLDRSQKYPPSHIELQVGIFQAISWLPLKECQESLGEDHKFGTKWPEKCLDIVARIIAGED